MGLFGGSGGYPVTSVSDHLLTHVERATDTITPTTKSDTLDSASGERALVHIRPFGDSDGFGIAGEFVRDLYRSANGNHPVESMEWWFTDGQLSQRFCTAAPDRFDQIQSARYQHSTVHSPDRTFLDLRPDEYVAGARLRLRRDCAFPIAHLNASHDPVSTDPYTSIASALAGPDDTRALVQCVFMPVDKHAWYQRGWYGSLRGSDVDDIAEHRKEGSVKGNLNPRIVESRTDRLTAKDMQRQRGRPAFQTGVRVVATGPTKQTVQTRLNDLISAFEPFAYSASEQAFVPEPLSDRALIDGFAEIAGRELPTQGAITRWLFGREGVLTDDELAGLVHLPNKDINAPLHDWARMESGAGTPSAKSQFEHGYAGDSFDPTASVNAGGSQSESSETHPADRGAASPTESGRQQSQHAPQATSDAEGSPMDEQPHDAESGAYAEQTGGDENE